MNYKKSIVGLAMIASSLLSYQIGKSIGYSNGFEDTKTRIRSDVSGVYREVVRKEDQAEGEWWRNNDTTKVFTRGEAHRFEKDAFGECYEDISDLLFVNIDRLTIRDVLESAEFDRKYSK